MAEFNDSKGDFNPYAPPAAVADAPAYAQAGEREDEVLIMAERGTRWWARFVDQLLAGVTALPGAFVWLSAKNELGPLLFVLTLAFMGYQWFLVSTTGQTLGKKWLGIKVVKNDGSPVNFVSGVLLREWVLTAAAFIPGVGNVVGLVDAVMIFGNDRRCMHDKIAGAKVVLALPST